MVFVILQINVITNSLSEMLKDILAYTIYITLPLHS